jgi:hypothetical protein
MSAPLVPARCNPHSIAEIVLADDEGVLTDDTDTALLIEISRPGSGFAFEYERQLPETP